MRIVVIDPLGAGDAALRKGLARAYRLTQIPRSSLPPRDDPGAVARWIAGDGFPDDSLLPYPGHRAPEVVAAIAASGAHVVTVLRNPYDAFVAGPSTGKSVKAVASESEVAESTETEEAAQ